MSRALTLRLAAVALLAAIGIAVIWAVTAAPRPVPDTPRLNDAVHRAQDAWPGLTADLFGDGVTVADLTGRVLATTSDAPPANALEAAEQRMMTAPVIVDGEAVGLVFVPDGTAEADRRARSAVAWTATALIAALALAAAGLLLWADARILRPFRRLSAFATDVAAGRLDAPLDMDRGNAFGAWSESFDLMRDELAEARRREDEANRSKQELVAQIGHDVRTPVASISATAEVLRARTHDPAVGERLDVILAKAGQIRQLMTDLSQANVAQSRSLAVVPIEFDAQRLATLVRDSDTAGRATVGPIPECLLTADPGRLAQVIDNVVANAAKYAAGALQVSARLDEPHLLVTFDDRGPGVPDAELGSLLGRGVRGSNVGDVPGEGLGLSTSAQLMERMGGSFGVANRPGGGFRVTLSIALAGTVGLS